MKNIPKLNDRVASFACVIAALLSSDETVSHKERSRAVEFLTHEFGIDGESANALLETGRSDIDQFDTHLAELKAALGDHKREAARFMGFLNSCITCDGVDDREYELFARVKGELF